MHNHCFYQIEGKQNLLIDRAPLADYTVAEQRVADYSTENRHKRGAKISQLTISAGYSG
jgi:hypothetical protein